MRPRPTTAETRHRAVEIASPSYNGRRFSPSSAVACAAGHLSGEVDVHRRQCASCDERGPGRLHPCFPVGDAPAFPPQARGSRRCSGAGETGSVSHLGGQHSGFALVSCTFCSRPMYTLLSQNQGDCHGRFSRPHAERNRRGCFCGNETDGSYRNGQGVP